ncbi:MAG TPA: sensor histidine kinase [Nitrososphaera sp.]|nr:sensor histidine kinase [Nitrososphaera sp.]
MLAVNIKMLLVIIIVISGISLSAYSLILNLGESNIRASLFEREKELQANRAEQLASNVGSDLELLMTKLQVLAESAPVQAGDFASPEADALMQQVFEESNMIARIEGVGMSNSDNIVMNVYQPEVDRNQLIGQDMSSRPFAVEARENLPRPTYSTGYETTINNQGQRIALLHPIYDAQGTHAGWTRSAVDASLFFERYGNIRDIESEYFSVIDSKGNILVSPRTELEGRNISDKEVQDRIGNDPKINEHVQKVLSGQIATSVFEQAPGERINTGYPIVIGGEPAYFVFLVTPTSSIYASINEVMFTNRLQASLLVAGIIGAISALVAFTVRWNRSLNLEVKRKTGELAGAVSKLEERDRLQKEFINIAAHELRTPIQPMLGMAEILEQQFGKKKDTIEVRKEEIDIIVRNAKRLERLSSDILDVARIESQSLVLNKKKFNLADSVREAISNTQGYLRNRDTKVDAQFEDNSGGKVTVSGDRGRIIEVIDNLLGNAIKFTEGSGTITVTLERKDGNAVISVRDTGAGIDPEIMPKLFSKFITKSAQGTGLGLFISKSIIEAHGGRIWAENNDGKGATFTFSLPLATP